MPILWPINREPQLFNTLGNVYALRAGLLRIANQTIHVACVSGENCGANFWINQKAGIVQVQYGLCGAGAMYAIAVDGTREIEDISRFGVELQEGAELVSRLPFRFEDERVQAVVIGIRLNEGLRDARQTGSLDVTHVELDEEAQPDVRAHVPASWLILVPVTTATTEHLERTYRFVVKDLGISNDAAGRIAGTSIENAIVNSIERVVFARVNHNQMFELRVSRTAFTWEPAQHIFDFLHVGRKYEVSELL